LGIRDMGEGDGDTWPPPSEPISEEDWDGIMVLPTDLLLKMKGLGPVGYANSLPAGTPKFSIFWAGPIVFVRFLQSPGQMVNFKLSS
jgi:hypothetical protein